MKRFAIVLLTSLLLANPAGAITNGTPDGNAHPYVGELFFYAPAEIDSRFDDPGAWFTCSGTLISPTVVVTAGHCVTGIGLDGVETPDCIAASGSDCGNDMWINFAEKPDFTNLPLSADYARDENALRYQDRATFFNSDPNWTRARAYVHPEFSSGPFLLHDVGVIVLSQPVVMAQYGVLPGLDYLEQYFATPRNKQRFTPVGYGLNKVRPTGNEGGDTREQASVQLLTLTGYGYPYGSVVLFSNNNGSAHRGGACFGDSGGPVLDGNTNRIVAITSFGRSPNCTGFDGAYRIDQQDDIDFLSQFLQ